MLPVILLFWVFASCKSSVPSTESAYLLTFYNSLSGNDSWSKNWNLYEGQADAEKSDELLGQSDTQLEFSSVGDSDYLIKMNLTKIGLVGTIPADLSDLSKLQTLILENNEIEGLADKLFENNAELKEINLASNSIKKFEGTFPASLTSLDMSENSLNMEISTLMTAIEKAENLEKLDLDGNKIYGEIPEDSTIYNNIATLKWISLANNKISGSLPDIKSEWDYLNISNNMFDGDFPENFKSNENISPRCNMFNCTSLKLETGENATEVYNIRECYCSERGKYAKNQSDGSVACESCATGKMANKWVRFNFWSVTSEYECETPTEGCVDCMFPRNCDSGACVDGSEGPTCEKCKKDYRMIAGKCEACIEKVPIAALVLIVVLAVIVGYGVFLSGLNILATTMIKQLFSYLQIYFLTMDIRANWPRFWGELGDVYKLSMMNSQAFDLECLTGLSTLNLYYTHWAVAVIWPIIMTVVVLSFDKSYTKRLHTLHAQSERTKALEQSSDEHMRNNESNYIREKQTGMRRIWIMFILIAFVPMTALSLRVYACEQWAPQRITVKWNDGDEIVENQWFYDNSISCNNSSFQGVAFLATMLLVVEFGVIVFLFLILFRVWRLFDAKDKNQSELFGALHESFTDRGLFCEPLLLLRKFILIITTQPTYVNPSYVAGGNCVLSLLWLMLMVIRSPYIPSTEGGRLFFLLNNWCNLFEIVATLLIFLTQLYGLINAINPDLVNPDQDGLVITLLVLHVLLVITWLAMFIVVLIKVAKSGIKEKKSRRSLRSLHRVTTLHLNPAATGKVTPVERPEIENGDDEVRARIPTGDSAQYPVNESVLITSPATLPRTDRKTTLDRTFPPHIVEPSTNETDF